jgi:CheY-like chemotaxis protein
MPLKLLVVDQDAATLALVEGVFCSHGVHVHTARDGAQAVAPIVEEKFDGFLLEMDLPNTDGCQLSSWIRRSSRNGRAPIIHMSARPDPYIMDRAFQSGGTFFLVKPLDRMRLMRLFRSTSGIMLQERRRYWRIPLSIPSRCEVGSRKLAGCSIRNLSVTGVLLAAGGALHPGVRVYLVFSLAESDASPISVWGTVVRVDESGQAGIRFTALRQEDYGRILDRIAAESDAA